jgi:hypothetical protein
VFIENEVIFSSLLVRFCVEEVIMDYHKLGQKLGQKLMERPDMGRDITPLMEKAAKLDREHGSRQASNLPEPHRTKTATKQSTVLFVEWCLLRGEVWSQKKVISWFEQAFNWRPIWREDRSGLRWERGDDVKISMENCEHDMTKGDIKKASKKFGDGSEGMIEKTEKEDRSLDNGGGEPGDVIITFDGGGKIQIAYGQAKQKSGLLTPDAYGDPFEGTEIEVVYRSQGSYDPSPKAIAETEEYLSNDQNREQLMSRYYHGSPSQPKQNKKDSDISFTMALNDARRWRTLSPAKGSVLYMGKTPSERPFNDVGRLKEEINRLLIQEGEEAKYDVE